MTSLGAVMAWARWALEWEDSVIVATILFSFFFSRFDLFKMAASDMCSVPDPYWIRILQ
jgi:hypothetical protein